MKKILCLLPVMAILFLAGCSNSDEEVARNFNVTVSLIAKDGITISDINDLEVTAVNLTTSKEQTATPADGKTSFSLPTGKYDFRATGVYEGQEVNGVANNVNVSADQTIELTIDYAAANSTLIFKEVYFAGVHDYYFKDGFYEIYNNSDEVQYLDGVILGIVDEGLPANIFTPTNSIWVDENNQLLDRYPMTSYTMYFPGNGTDYPLQPGESVVVAAYPIDHTSRQLSENDEPSPVNLSGADWEIFCGPHSVTDVDVPNVPNLEYGYHTFGIEFMPSTSGQALILAKLPDGQKVVDFVADSNNFMTAPGKSQLHLMIPSDYVIDGIEIVRAPVNERYKHLLPKTDMGMTWVDGSDNGSLEDAAYSGKSLRRKVASVENGITKFKDTNNSSIDFIVGGGVPTPGIIPTTVYE
ncbi:DUF4876 domain-containing protein [uncultured Bacteroides sp.]|uniref:DUF4876 domain-containing protein n=1 Tax=uncultured Bacteroides sp. TaxID=162156 RepID=UPI0026176009|nr:DUF4876 domain-containing protein [uncultured Bacteroides sp.]